ncbi:MAG: hypothetical protein WC393_00385 [Candidatus Nanoarchaeia archaeon]|jgi:hypothetical protein
MYIKTKIVKLKSGKLQKYYYVAMSVRKGKLVKPVILRYLGKNVHPKILHWMKEKNKWLRDRRKNE